MKYCGRVGFAKAVKTAPGVWTDTIIERTYYGNVSNFNVNAQQGEQLNDDVDISNRISIIADSFADENCGAIKYLTFMGHAWKVKSIEVSWPRLILSVGGEYNGPQASTAESPGTDTGN